MDGLNSHRSHISAGEAKTRGWSNLPSQQERDITKQQEVGTSYMAGEYLTLSACNISSSSVDLTGTTTIKGWNDYMPIQTWSGQWYPPQPAPQQQIPFVQTVTQIIKEKEVTKEVEKRTLFEVFVVDPRRNGKILLDGFRVIAVNENQAMLKAGVGEVAAKANLELEQVDVYVRAVGTFIRPRKEIQKVKQVTEEDD